MYEKKAVKIIVIIILAMLMLCACNNTPATTETAESETVVDYQRETYIPSSTLIYTGMIIETENINKPDYITAYEDIEITEAQINLLITQEEYVAASEAERVEMVNNLMLQLSTEGTEEFPYPVVAPDWSYDEENGLIQYDYIGGGGGMIAIRDGWPSNTIAYSDLDVMGKLELVDNRLTELEQTTDYCNSRDDERAALVADVLAELAMYGTDEYPYPLLDSESIEINTDCFGEYYFVGFTIDGVYCQFDVSEYPDDPTAIS